MQTLLLTFNSVVLVALLMLLVLFAVSIVFHLRCKVPFVPTPRRVIRAMVDAAALKDGDLVMDLGAGDGRILLHAKRTCPGITAVGYEGSFGVWLLARFRQWWSGGIIDVRRKNFLEQDLSGADVLFLYLTIDALRPLMPKFQRDLRPGTRIISHAFRLPDRESTETREVKMPLGGTVKVHVYRW